MDVNTPTTTSLDSPEPDQATPSSTDYSMARRATITSSLGTALEWIDFTAYGALAATVFPIIFFPDSDPTTGLIASLATFGVGYGARPLGAILFGYIGDRWGRKQLLMITLIMMGLVSLLMAALPTYHQIGIWAPILLVTLRLLQGVALGGESTGAQLLTIEHAPPDKRGIYGAYTQIGNPGSQLICNALLVILSTTMTDSQFESFGWRIPFLVSFFLVGIGIYTRLRVAESPAFEEAARSGKIATRYVLRSHPGTVIRLLFTWVGITVCSKTSETFSIAYATGTLGLPRSHVFLAVMFATGFAIIPMLIAGKLADRFGTRNTLLGGAVVMMCAWLAFFPLMNTANIFLIGLAVTLVYGCVGYFVGPMALFFAESFPTDVRYSGSALAYTGSALFFAAPTPILAVYLLDVTGGVGAFTIVGVVAIATTITLLWFSKDRRYVTELGDLDETKAVSQPR